LTPQCVFNRICEKEAFVDISDIKTVAVIGVGDMGHGIAEVALIAGYKVYLRDIKQEFVDRGVFRIMESLEKTAQFGKEIFKPTKMIQNGECR
jgi:3-hydroxyacyl-CoA dehydrogenase